MPNIYRKILVSGLLIMAVNGNADANVDWKNYFGLAPTQQKQFDQANKDKAATVKTLREKEQPLIESLRQQVDAKGSDAQISSAFSEVRNNGKSIQEAQEQFLNTVSTFLTPTQEAKLLLKNYKPKSAGTPPSPPVQHIKPPEDSAKRQASKVTAEEWKQYFALTPDQKKQLDAANKSKNQTMKELQAEKETALHQLSQKIDANVTDAEVKVGLDAVRHALIAIPNAENTYWDGLASILTPTQEAKLFLKGKPKKI